MMQSIYSDPLNRIKVKAKNGEIIADIITCPNFVRKLLPMFKYATAISSLDLSAWAMAKAPSSCASSKEEIMGRTTHE